MDTTAALKWLESICAPAGGFQKDWLTKRFTCRGFVCATDGHAFLAVKLPHNNKTPEMPEGSGKHIAHLFDWPPVGVSVTADLADLQAWCAPPDEACDECSGTRKVTCYCRGLDGNEKPEKGCEDCDGTGKQDCDDCPDVRSMPGVIDGNIVINRTLLRKIVGPAPPCTVMITTQQTAWKNINDAKPVRFDGEDWRALLMPMRADAAGLSKFTAVK